jgi:DNA-binding ferritin-like protein (Dps family)
MCAEIINKRYTNKYDGIYLYIYPHSTVTQNMKKHIFKNIIVVTLETPIDIDDFNSKCDTDSNKWTPQIENYLKDQVIKSIDIVK